MRIVVCIKQVPDTTEVKIDPVKGTIIRDGVPSIMNPDDKGGLEEALKLKDLYGAEVIVITMGPPQAEAILREAYAMGADRAILITDRKFGGADTLATSNTIAAAIRKIEDIDLIVAGRQAIDGDTAQVGPQIAEHLGLPQVSYVKEMEYKEDSKSFVIKRATEDGYFLLELPTPAPILNFLSSIFPKSTAPIAEPKAVILFVLSVISSNLSSRLFSSFLLVFKSLFVLIIFVVFNSSEV